MTRIYANPKDERAFLTDLSGQGTYVASDPQVTDKLLDLGDRVLICYWSKGTNAAVEIPCSVVGRRFAHNERRPRGVKVKVNETQRGLIRILLDEV